MNQEVWQQAWRVSVVVCCLVTAVSSVVMPYTILRELASLEGKVNYQRELVNDLRKEVGHLQRQEPSIHMNQIQREASK